MKRIHLFLILIGITLLAGCAGTHSLTMSPIANAPSVDLSQNNFRVVKYVEASASCTYVFGIGGLSQKALRQNAVADMMLKANLKGSQAVINIVTKVSRKIITPFYIKTTMRVQGTVVEFENPSFNYTVEIAESQKEEISNKPEYDFVATSPMGLIQSGDIRLLEQHEQHTILEIAVEDVHNDMISAKSVEELNNVKDKLTMVKTYSGLMKKSTRKDVDKLDEKIAKKMKRLKK